MLTMDQIEAGFAELRASLDGFRLAMVDGFRRMRDDLRAELGGLVESLRDDVRAIADGHLALNERMERLEQGQEAIREDVAYIRIDVGGLKYRMTRQERATAALTKTTAALTKTTAVLEKRTSKLEKQTSKLDRKTSKLVVQMGRVYRHLRLNGGRKPERARRRLKAETSYSRAHVSPRLRPRPRPSMS
jgi:chromosome segregation ATPase